MLHSRDHGSSHPGMGHQIKHIHNVNTSAWDKGGDPWGNSVYGAPDYMSELVIEVPDYVRRQAEAVAAEENISLNELAVLALACHVSAWQTKDHMEARARRGSWQKALELLQAAPDNEPPDWDKIPAGYQPPVSR